MNHRGAWAVMDAACTALLAMGTYAMTTGTAFADIIGVGAVALALGMWTATSRERLDGAQ